MPILDRAERAGYRAVLALPTRVQRVLAGRPLRSEGQTLATDVQASLRLMKITREPELASLPIPEGRAQVLRVTALAGGTQPIGAVRDLPVGERQGRLYVPSGASSPGPMLVWFHGGGWVYGDLDSHDPACRFLAERSGVRVLSVDYRLAPEHPFPAAYNDCVASYRWVVEHAESLGADPARLAVGGDSAGGHAGGHDGDRGGSRGLPLAWQLLLYPGTDMRGGTASRARYNQGLVLTQEFLDVATSCYLTSKHDELDPRASPLLDEVPAGLAPAYVVTAGFDPLRDEGEAYARKLADAGVEIELKRFPDQIHAFLHVVGVGRTGRAAVAEIAHRLRAAMV